MSGKVLDRLGVNTCIQKIGDVGMPQQVRCHIEVQAIHNVGIVFLMSSQTRLNSVLDALATEAASAWYLTLKNLLATFATHPWRWGHSGLRWRGCHNSTASFYSCAAEFPPSL